MPGRNFLYMPFVRVNRRKTIVKKGVGIVVIQTRMSGDSHFLYIENTTTPESCLILKRASVLIHITEKTKNGVVSSRFFVTDCTGTCNFSAASNGNSRQGDDIYNDSLYETETKMCG